MHRLMLAMTIAAAPAAARPPLTLTEKTSVLDFSWQVPAAVAAEPKLYARLRADAEKQLASDRQDAASDAAGRRPGDHPVRYSTDLKWEVAADAPPLLVLGGESWAYTGGAHGNGGPVAMLWDRRAQAEVKLPGLFTDWPRLAAAIRPRMCKALAAARAEKRGDEALGPPFDACPPLADATVLIAGPPPLKLRVQFAPYAAGPYSEGEYDLDLAWPGIAPALLRPAYRTLRLQVR